MHDFYPDLITSLPEANIPFKGVRGWISQSVNHQVVYMDIEPIGEVAEHSHAAQWGYVLEGEMKLRIDGVEKTYLKGDSYYIPENVIHSAVFETRTFIMDVFAERNRYKQK